MNNNNNRCNSKSITIRTLQDDNFIPFYNVDPDTFINALEDEIVDHIIDDHDFQEFSTIGKNKNLFEGPGSNFIA